METGLPAPQAWVRGGLGKVGFGGPHHPVGSSRSLPHHPSAPHPARQIWHPADIRPFSVPNPTPAIPKPTTVRPTSSEAAGREPRAPFAPVRRGRGAENPVALGLGLPETPGRLPGSGP